MRKVISFLPIFLMSVMISSGPVKGTASYYGQHWTGRKTASGETFYSDSLTAAHKYYKFGTIVKVTNLKNNDTILVKINDRLPKSSKMIIDLSYGCAKKLNIVKAGIVPVQLDIVDTIPIIKK
jgi:rare lipoprotein A